MKDKKDIKNKGEVIIYKTKQGPELEVRLRQETVWLDAHQMTGLFDVNRPAIVKHINNIYNSKELNEHSTCSILEQVAADKKIRKMNLYNLDMIISIGYRVNSQRATQFRIWATKTLKEHLVRGYTINEKRLLETKEKLAELQSAISFLREKSKHGLLAERGPEILDLLAYYSSALAVLDNYDKDKLVLPKGGKTTFRLTYELALEVTVSIKKELAEKKQASDIFGKESADKLQGILAGLWQTFGGRELYKSLEEKAAHLLYLIIKDYPFIDGNKRIASFLFVYFLDKNGALYRASGEKKISDNALVAMALLMAISDPKDKEIMIKIIVNLLK